MAEQLKLSRLESMDPTMTHFTTVALIVSKTTPTYFTDKMDGTQRGVLTLTIRDGLTQFTNCKCWGQTAWVQDYFGKLRIGQVVAIINAKVKAVDQDQQSCSSDSSRNNRYDPTSPLSCGLVVNEGQGKVQHYEPHPADDFGHFCSLGNLLHRPLKSMASALKLADVMARYVGAETESSVIFVDVVVVVAAVRPLRKVKRAEKAHHNYAQPIMLDCLEVVLSDPSHAEGMLLTIWQEDWIGRGQTWKPLQTVLHLVDVKVSFSKYHQCPTFSHVGCTLICEDPHPPSLEANNLMEFAASLKFYSFESFALPEMMCQLPFPENITEAMSVQQIYSRTTGMLQDPSVVSFTAVLRALISTLDLDGLTPNISRQCSQCRRFIPRVLVECPTEMCQQEVQQSGSPPPWINHFNINVHFSDQSGTLVEGRLSGVTAERVLGLSASAFVQLPDREKGLLKWRFLLRHFEAKLLVLKPMRMRKNMVVVVVDMFELPVDQLSQLTCCF
ncbi:uncharacterized protein Dana_GF21091, isoform A [Drosophila ananassae]|uniref:Uncharacterized protein, isoform A n=1 Tax=Drosophila ananassae TaxID=7217 RepID=B3MR04_DROAN|nr:protein hold'em [Drosophila ananassae]EDV34209.1 uncharacterized protein Dana_GF21091, isoform A [Drosophila ananassae]